MTECITGLPDSRVHILPKVDVQCELSVQSLWVRMTHVRSTATLYNMIHYCIIVAGGNIGRIFTHNEPPRTLHTLHTLHITLCSAISMIMRLKTITINHNGETQGSAWNAYTQMPPHLNGPRWGAVHSALLLPCESPPISPQWGRAGSFIGLSQPVIQQLPPTMAGDTGHNNIKAWNAEALLF